MEQVLYLGSYTKRESKGVHQIILDTDKKELRDYRLIAEVDSPTYLDLSADKETLYAISKTDEGGGVTSFKENENGTYDKVSEISAEGSAPCYIYFDEEKKLIFTANYHGGYLTVYKENADGSFTMTDRAQHEGSSIHENQTIPHVHYSALSPDKKFLLSCDLGTDEVYTYTVSAEGKLAEVARYKATPGTGPRHLVFHPNGKVAYMFGELSSDVEVLAYDAAAGTFSLLQVITTIPEEHTGFNGGAAIRISADGKFLYASNRGHDSLVVYAVSEDGETLSLVEYVPTEGNIPRDFNLDPSGQFVIVAHQDSDNLTLFERDAETGKLTLLQKDVYAPECVCVFY